MIDPETGYHSNWIFCHTNHFSSYKLEETVGQDACTDILMSFPGSAPGKLQKNLHANTHLEHLSGKLRQKKKSLTIWDSFSEFNWIKQTLSYYKFEYVFISGLIIRVRQIIGLLYT